MTRLLRLFAAKSLITSVIFLCAPLTHAAVTPVVVAGSAHSIGLKYDGTVWTWGSNVYGQLGNGTNIDSATPVQVSSLTGVVAIAAGFYHSLAIKSDGTVWAWGNNSDGQLGNTTTCPCSNSNVPVQMTGVANGIAVAGGLNHSLVLTSGGIRAAGDNTFGQIGDATNMQRATAVAVVLPGVAAIAAGRNHSLAMTTGGAVYAWGDDSVGQLGDGALVPQNAPELNLTLANIVRISSRDSAGLALDSSGAIWGWGANDYGQVGDGSLVSPVKTPLKSMISNDIATSVTSGAYHSLAITQTGSIIGWGTNTAGQLSNVPFLTYTSATGLQLISGVSQLAGGVAHSLGYTSGGTVIAFGGNGSGQLGDGTTTNRYTPVTVVGLGGVGYLNLLGLNNVSVTVAGSGIVGSSPAGLECSSGTCVGAFGSGAVVTLTATPTGGNIFEGWSGACTGTGTCTVTVNGGESVTATFSGNGAGGAVAGTIPATGWWWNPAESGRGFMIEASNGKLFMATFLYSFSGEATWFGSGPAPFNGGNYTGVLNLYGSGQTLTGAYKPATLVGGSFGAISINFSSSTTGSITWPEGIIPIERFDIVPGGSSATPPAGTPQAGWWWNPNESGRGFSLEIQKNTMLIAGYMYDTSGNPIWYSSQGAMTGSDTYQGNWVQYGYGQTLTGSYQAPEVFNADVGALTIQFTSPTAGNMTLPDGRVIPIERFLF
jgi:alpha-tubulin suppressor-like RCC1 family protein